ncbi:MAG: adenylate/guanylate cyclase domain-containing protein [Desulfobulbaceae bacterium]|nr:adenylate/guanylate cyclase domain-containing protein [Desulfobulbaceae bacterium]
MRAKTIAWLIGLGVTLLSVGMMAWQPEPLVVFDAKIYDYLLAVRGPRLPPEAVVIADIDERSLARIGRWPWSREQLARMVRALAAAEPTVIALDIILSEPEVTDPLLVAALSEAGMVVLPLIFDFKIPGGAPMPEDINRFSLGRFTGQEAFSRFPPLVATSVTVPVAPLREASLAMGHINIFPDPDGTLRWDPLLVAYQERLYPSFSLMVAGLYLGYPPTAMVVRATEGISLSQDRFIPTDPWGHNLINYYGPDKTFPRISLVDILEGAVAPERLRDKIVLVGASAVGIYDLRVTPLAAAMPGVEKHASVIASILDNQLLRKNANRADQGLVLVAGLLFALLVSRLRALTAIGATVLSLAVIGASGYAALVHWGLWIGVGFLLGNTLLVFIAVTAYNFTVAESSARRIRKMFSSYVTERVVNELVKSPSLAKLGGGRCEVTVLFADLRGFTTFSETNAPEEVVAQLNEYLGVMTEVILRWEGTLDKFIGDAIMAFWGAPLSQPNHAELAFRCTMEMVERLDELRAGWRAAGKPLLDCGIGLNTGDVLVGNIGKEGKKMDYTVIGDHVNLASRVEGLTKKFQARILITENTLSHLRDRFAAGAFGHVSIEGQAAVVVKGKQQAVKVYRVQPLAEGDPSSLRECAEAEALSFTEK